MTTSSCSTTRCNRSLTNTRCWSDGPGASVVMIVGGCPLRHAKPSDIVGTWSNATIDHNPPRTGRLSRHLGRPLALPSHVQGHAIKQRFDDASGDAAATWRPVHNVLHRDQWQVHSDSQYQMLASGFSQFFIDKLARIHQSIAPLLQSSGPVFDTHLHTGPMLSLLAPTSAAEV